MSIRRMASATRSRSTRPNRRNRPTLGYLPIPTVSRTVIGVETGTTVDCST